ncbi:MAG: TPM domain-containing protein [Firmicutes bacterium]|nr:TPM domain-containing protein [Bacillota bacterium]
MKKILLILGFICLFFSGQVYAQEIEVFFRSEENRYGIPERFEVNDTTISASSKIPYVDSSVKVYDFANLYTEEEVQLLQKRAQEISKRENHSVVIVTIDRLDYYSTLRSYSDDFYDYNDFGLDGILFFIALKSRDVYISTSGNGQLLFDDRIDPILDELVPSLSNNDFYTGTNEFLNQVEYYFEEGISREMSRCEITDELGYYQCKKAVPVFGICIGSLIVSFIITFFMAKSYKKIKLAHDADHYVNQKDVSLGNTVDRFVNTYTTRVYVSSSSGSSSSGGGSRSHSGSSGGSHGGGGRKF